MSTLDELRKEVGEPKPPAPPEGPSKWEQHGSLIITAILSFLLGFLIAGSINQ